MFLDRTANGLEPIDVRKAPVESIHGMLIVRPDEMLFFANASSIRDEIARAAAEASPHAGVVLLDLSLTPEVDVPSVEALEQLHGRLAEEGVELWLCRLRPAVRELLERAGTLAIIGADHVYLRPIDGVLAYILTSAETEDRSAVLNELMTWVRERRAIPGTTAVGLDLLSSLEERFALELAAEDARVASDPPAPGDVVAD